MCVCVCVGQTPVCAVSCCEENQSNTGEIWSLCGRRGQGSICSVNLSQVHFAVGLSHTLTALFCLSLISSLVLSFSKSSRSLLSLSFTHSLFLKKSLHSLSLTHSLSQKEFTVSPSLGHSLPLSFSCSLIFSLSLSNSLTLSFSHSLILLFSYSLPLSFLY